MEMIYKTFNSCSKNISFLLSRGSFIEFKYAGPLEKLYDDRPELSSVSFLTEKLEKGFSEALKLIPYYRGLAEGSVLIRDMLIRIGSELSFTTFAGSDGGSVFFSNIGNNELDLDDIAKILSDLFQNAFGYPLYYSIVTSEHAVDILNKRLVEAKNFYLSELYNWLNAFIPDLADNLSRVSFLTYLRQRILAKVFYDSDICYPVKPPAATSSWRKTREQLSYDYPILYDVDGHLLEERHFKLVYVYQQYSIPGHIAPAPKDVVVDAGAFIGDTGVWFSQQVGSEGKVFSFEPSLRNVHQGKLNMQRLGINNVKFFPYALSDHAGKAAVLENESSSSVNRIIAEDTNISETNTINVVTLDSMRKDLGKVNFIKADIEGSEMAMLRGASEIIKADAPVCAICLYHKRDDFWQIPQCLLELRPDYKFWFRCEAEPVLFAKCENAIHA